MKKQEFYNTRQGASQPGRPMAWGRLEQTWLKEGRQCLAGDARVTFELCWACCVRLTRRVGGWAGETRQPWFRNHGAVR